MPNPCACEQFATASFELALTPGETPRLWIDLITSIVMEPDPKTYRVMQDGQNLIDGGPCRGVGKAFRSPWDDRANRAGG